MRSVVLIVCLALAAGAMAEEKPKPRTVVKQIDKSSPALAATDDSGDAAEATDAKEKANKTRAQDYNSSRSNISTAAGGPRGDLGKENRCSIGRLDCDDDGDSIPTKERCGNGIDNDCDSIDEKSAPANHNTTRSNRTQPTVDGEDPVVRKKPRKQ